MVSCEGKVCLNHTDVPAAACCAACGKPVCAACIVRSDDGSAYCSEPCKTAAAAASKAANAVLEEKARTGKKSKLRKFIVFLILVLIALGGYYFYTQNKEKVDSSLQQGLDSAKSGVNMVKGAAAETVDAAKKDLDRDTKYKRDRQGIVNQ